LIAGSLQQGDCLEIARGLSPGQFRLIYLDPPFFSGKARIGACPGFHFDDSWPGSLREYLDWLRPRLEAFIPLLLPSGSLVVHLDHHAVHYVKVILDELLGYHRFVNEIIWHYTGGGRSRRQFSRKHDTLLWYARGPDYLFHIDAVRVPYKPTSGYARSGITAASGKKYRPHPAGTPVDDVWEIPIINPLARERTGYPTQKPLVLLERIIQALTDPGDLVGDFFCGSGTTLVAARNHDRRWMGIDISEAAIACAQKRLFPPS
jgi:DNA modification methylase